MTSTLVIGYIYEVSVAIKSPEHSGKVCTVAQKCKMERDSFKSASFRNTERVLSDAWATHQILDTRCQDVSLS